MFGERRVFGSSSFVATVFSPVSDRLVERFATTLPQKVSVTKAVAVSRTLATIDIATR
jgi:hypothetical protein